MKWYYAVDGTKQGPVSHETLLNLLRQGTVTPDDYVWFEGMGDTWKRAGEVPELAPGMPTGSPHIQSPLTQDFKPIPQEPSGDISCTTPVASAWERMSKWLFKPFDMGKWFALGFSAWLATLAQGGAGGMSWMSNLGPTFPGGSTSHSGSGGGFDPKAIGEAFAYVWSHIHPYMVLIAPVTLLVLALSLFILWVQCRGKFMFLDNIVNDRTDVKRPWTNYAAHAHSLFIWKIGYGVITFLIFGACVLGLILTFIVPLIQLNAFASGMLLPITFFGILIILLSIANAYVLRFLEDFIIPIMYQHNLKTNEAWGKFRELSAGNIGPLL
ncbi:MAG: DUF4339 domain-containing protein, partial [Verrucomicrobia bacterium]|nr:DUF4339 domain-containing protein [Verrucomicrobiota bacterium]